MEQRMKQRLVGAVVLVALAVIFIPMLLDGPVERDPANIPIEIPPKPAVSVAPALPGQEPAGPAPAISESTPVETAPAVAPPAPAEPPASPPPVAEPAPAPVAQPAPAEPADTPSRPAELATWAVQVGSFGDQANAASLRDKLRKKGYAAYVESVKASGKTFYRVRVGPIAQRAEADALQARIAAQESLPAQVRPHP